MNEYFITPEKKYLKESTPSVFVLFFVLIAMVAVCLSFSYKNRKTIEKQNVELLINSANESEKYLTVIFSYSRLTINAISKMFEKQMTSPNVDYRQLKEIRKNTPFDYIRFVNEDGIATDSEGRAMDASDREYYIDGIKGGSNVDAVKGSRFTSEFVFAAYAPLYYKNEIIGVFTGILSEATLTTLLQQQGFFPEATTYLCTRNGDIVASSKNSRDPTNIIMHCKEEGTVSTEVFEEIKLAFEQGTDGYLFRYKSNSGAKDENIAYIKKSSENDWMMVQTFPSSITEAVVQDYNKSALKMEIFCTSLFLLYIAYFMYTEIRKRKHNDEANSKKLLKSSRNLADTIAIISDRYYKVLKCDLDTGECELIKLNMEDNYVILFEDIDAWMEKLIENDFIYKDDIETVRSFFDRDDLKKRLMNGEKLISCQYRRIVNGDLRWVKMEIQRSSEFTPETPVVILYLLDIEDDIKKQLALQEAYDSAIKANRAKTQFLSSMSHDIRTPMHAIIGMTNLAGVHLDDQEKIKECLQKITVSSKHLLGLINDVLDMSKIESGHIDLSMEEFNISQVIENLITMTREQLNTKKHELEISIADIQHEHVVGDSQRIQQVFMNMMSNAIKYTPEGGHIKIFITEKTTSKPHVGCYEFVFEDNGIGMSEEYVKHIFEPFTRAEDDDRVRKIQGTGLGMSISRNIVQMMNGDIKVESELNKGTKFTVTIYLELQNSGNIEPYEQFTNLPILVIDDDRAVCQYTCDILREFGMKPEYAISGKEALELVKKRHEESNHFFAIIVDWKMPDMDGLETTKKIRDIVGDEIPIIIISAYDWSQIETAARSAGANYFISKPLFKSRLNALFHRLTQNDEKEVFSPRLADFAKNDFTGKRVLLVEDIELIAEMTTEILKMANLEVEVAHNGKEAADKVKEVPDGYYDLIFMDIQMPIMNGLEAAKTIRGYDREYTKTVPIIAMSANTFSDDIITAKNAGMNEHIGKPFEFDDLIKVLNKWL